jgi:hypothetical protein
MNPHHIPTVMAALADAEQHRVAAPGDIFVEFPKIAEEVRQILPAVWQCVGEIDSFCFGTKGFEIS